MIGYPGRQHGAILPAQEHLPCPAIKMSPKAINKSFLDQVCLVKMAGYSPPSFFGELWTLTPSHSINKQKKRTWPISSHIDLTLGQ